MHATPALTPGVAQRKPAGHGFAVAVVLPVPTQKPAAQAVAAGVDDDEPEGHQKPAAHEPVHAAAWLVRPGVLPKSPAGQSVHDVAPAADHDPAGHCAHAEPLMKDPAWQSAVPAKVTPPERSLHAELVADDDDAPSARQRTLPVARLSARVGGLGTKVYEVGAGVSAPVGVTVAAVHVGEPV